LFSPQQSDSGPRRKRGKVVAGAVAGYWGGFKNDDDAAKAVTLIKKAATQPRGR
jgi:hypothetical protein